MPARITAVINQKGGVGKTSTAEALWSGLQLKGLRCLAVDLDPQANMSFSARAGDDGPSAFGLLLGEAKPEDVVRHTPRGDIVPAGVNLATVDARLFALNAGVGKEFRLKETLEPLLEAYDHVIVDTPPSLGTLTVNALTAAAGIVIPCHADAYSIQGVAHLAETLALARKYSNAALAVDGILLTRFSPRAVVRRELAAIARTVAGQLGTKVFQAAIREGVAVTEAQLEGVSIFAHAPKSNVAHDYQEFIDEWLEAAAPRPARRRRNG